MFRRAFRRLCPAKPSTPPRFQTHEAHSADMESTLGAFDAATVADKLGIEPRYAQGLLMQEDRLTFKGRGRMWPASVGRTSRPGAKACTYQAMFPLYNTEPEIKYKLDKSFKKLTNQ